METRGDHIALAVIGVLIMAAFFLTTSLYGGMVIGSIIVTAGYIAYLVHVSRSETT